MLAISSIKIGQYQPIQSINTKNNNYPIKKTTNIIGQYSYPAIYFMGAIDRIQRPPLKEKTKEKLDLVYKNYKNKLNETTPEDIENVFNNIQQKSNYSKPEILNAMQLVTQFGNMESLKTIGKALNENDIGFIPNNSIDFQAYINNSNIKNTLQNNFGLNASLHYCFNKKELQTLNGHNIGILIDNNKLSDLEKLSEDEITEIKNRKNIKFFVLSGFENGVNFIDRTKDLKQQTINLLNYAKKNNMPVDKAIDNDILKRCKNIGIKPIIIKNEKDPTINNIYKQLSPKQISINELKATIDAAAINSFKEPNKQVACINGLVQYLENTLENYTPERMSKDLKKIHSKINKQVKLLGKTPEDIIYIIPEAGKSYDLINYQYQKINNIPKDKFITLKDETSLKKINTDNKVLVILDDCSLSGSSLLEDENFNYYTTASNAKLNNSNIIFAPIYISKEAEERLQKAIDKRNRTTDDFIIYTDTNNKTWKYGIKNDVNKSYLEEALGEKCWEDSRYCIIFPYMSPDNNSEFAANIALFHNINYKEENNNNNKFDNFIFSLSNIKTFFDHSQKIAEKASQLLMEEK